LFYACDLDAAVHSSGKSSRTTHAAPAAFDGCRYFGALIAAAACGLPKEALLALDFWRWGSLHPEIASIAQGSFRTNDPPDIEGSGYVVKSLEAALWALARSESFDDGVLLAVNLGDDADTTGAVYGQLAGALYGEEAIRAQWRQRVARHGKIVEFADQLWELANR
jgi:ADP-ribosylglycohydrolase